MVDYLFKRKVFTIRELAFTSVNHISPRRCDVVYLHSTDERVLKNASNIYARMQYTLTNDLSLPMEDIITGIKKNCKYEIRRAEKEGAAATFYCELQEHIIDDFEKTYNDMFIAKGMKLTFNRKLIEAGLKEHQIIISSCSIPAYPKDRVYHAYMCDGNRAMLVYSASPLWDNDDKEKANCIGRMNKYLHFKDMEYFKNSGHTAYEWGGISDPDNQNGIDRFKAEFGGEQKCYCNYIISQSLIGKAYVYLIKRRSRT